MSKPRIVVIGAGINGRMIQHLVPEALLLDWNPTPTEAVKPTFYGANYLWEPIPGLPCRKFLVETTIDGHIATLDGIRRYKTRVGKANEIGNDDALMYLMATQFKYHMMGYELEQYPVAFVRYGCFVEHIDLDGQWLTLKSGESIHYDYLLSTVPLPSLLGMANRLTKGFKSQMVRVRIRPNTEFPVRPGVLSIDYITDTSVAEYRRTYRGNEVQDETLNFKFAGEGDFKKLLPGKIWDDPRTPAILEDLAKHGVFTFGRYGSWNSDELVHETVKRIARWAIANNLEVSDHARRLLA